MSPAVAAVFDTAELLEQILLRLPMVNLAKAQRVSQQWKRVTDHSTPLQQALFRKATPATTFVGYRKPDFETKRTC